MFNFSVLFFCVSNYTPICKDRFDTYFDNLGIDLMDSVII